eukprot:4532349-Pleurochrysis_carterae.AAC.1
MLENGALLQRLLAITKAWEAKNAWCRKAHGATFIQLLSFIVLGIRACGRAQVLSDAITCVTMNE